MTFVDVFKALKIEALRKRSVTASIGDVYKCLAKARPSLEDFAILISPAADAALEDMGRRSQTITRQRFGKVIRLFAPLYLSNECINTCQYCGFSRDNQILRVTLSTEEVEREAVALEQQGFRNVLLVAGEHPRFVSKEYLSACVSAVRARIPGVSIEVGPMETLDYLSLTQKGAEGLVVYQETYDRIIYGEMHTAGPKRDFEWRLATAERGYEAGFRRLGIGALFGLADWRHDALCLAVHAEHLLNRCWKASLTISLPRLRPCTGEFEPRTHIDDRQFVKLVCALRILFPDVGLTLSTREPGWLRDGLLPIGITLVSAGSHTEPGGYSGVTPSKLHRTERGRILELGASERTLASQLVPSRQFEIADSRSPDEVASLIKSLGYDPVWKDWDRSITE